MGVRKLTVKQVKEIRFKRQQAEELNESLKTIRYKISILRQHERELRIQLSKISYKQLCIEYQTSPTNLWKILQKDTWRNAK